MLHYDLLYRFKKTFIYTYEHTQIGNQLLQTNEIIYICFIYSVRLSSVSRFKCFRNR